MKYKKLFYDNQENVRQHARWAFEYYLPLEISQGVRELEQEKEKLERQGMHLSEKSFRAVVFSYKAITSTGETIRIFCSTAANIVKACQAARRGKSFDPQYGVFNPDLRL